MAWESLFGSPWALCGISAGAMMSTAILDDVDDEAKSLSSMYITIFMGRMYRRLYITSLKMWVTALRVVVSVDPETCHKAVPFGSFRAEHTYTDWCP